MTAHGFASASEFTAIERSDDKLVLELRSSKKTLIHYPIDFVFRVTFQLEGDVLKNTYHVENHSNVVMPFGVGGHPGFNVPLDANEKFEDYYLEFSLECQPDRVGFTPEVYLNGHDEAYPLEDGKRIALRHDLFDNDAVILKNVAREVTLRSHTSARSITVSYPQMPYLGIWHWPRTNAPYVCIEPWTSLPSRQDVVEELTCKSDLVRLEPGQVYDNIWSITLK
jgi:galactose mutarotase-like enzyme